MSTKKKLAAVGCSLILAVGLGVITAAPAQAVSYIWICNNPSSDAWILAYRTSSPFTEAQIGPGDCTQFNDNGGDAKVDTELINDGHDIKKYRRSKDFGPWTSWVCNGTQHASDPYSGAYVYTDYWVSEFSTSC